MKKYYLSMKEQLEEEKEFYREVLEAKDWKYLKKAGELFLIHAYYHLFGVPSSNVENTFTYNDIASKSIENYVEMQEPEIFGDAHYLTKYSQFHLNLAIGLELILKSALLKTGEKINKTDRKGNISPSGTISLGDVIERYLNKLLNNLNEETREEIKDTLLLINLRRNNFAHCSKKSQDHYAHECRFSYVTLYLYDKFFYGENNTELTKLLLRSFVRSRVKSGSDFKQMRIIPKSLKNINLSLNNT
jgi:hypothetical protein